MPHADYNLDDLMGNGPGHGGRREGSGRKPEGYVKPVEVVDFERARARNEAAKADRNELEFRVQSGLYVERAAVQQATATIMSGLAQSLRSIRDNLERSGVPLDICEKVDEVIDGTLESASQDMQLFAGPVGGEG